jgi:protoheme IX farnesyltransferase
MGWLYLAAAVAGGAHLLSKAGALARQPGRASAMASFHASLVQLTLILCAAIADVAWHG